jgi:hypothetical protein
VDGNGAAPTTAPPSTVRRLDGAEAVELAGLAAVYEELQYVLRCCEHLVTTLASPNPDPVVVEALWTGALLGYARCFSGQAAVLTEDDLTRLELDADASGFHQMMRKLRDHYASRHVNPREAFTIGAAQSNDGRPAGVAIVSTPRPLVDDATVRLLGRIAYGLSGLMDARMQESQERVSAAAGEMSAAALARLPVVHLSGTA